VTGRCRPRGSAANERGFTLIEVLASLVIVALGMMGAIEAVNQSVRNGTYLREKTLAHWIAMNVITERRIQPTPPDTTETSGDLDFAGEQWHWTLKVTQTEVKSLRRMDVTVRRASAPDGSSLAALSGFYGTAVAASGGSTLNWAGTGAPGTGDQGQDDESGGSSNNDKKGKRPRNRLPDDMAE
jgi:general secretion pathway protein I